MCTRHRATSQPYGAHVANPPRPGPPATRLGHGCRHVEERRNELGERVLREGIEYPSFKESLLNDESKMPADNLTEVREKFFERALPEPEKDKQLPAPDTEKQEL